MSHITLKLKLPAKHNFSDASCVTPEEAAFNASIDNLAKIQHIISIDGMGFSDHKEMSATVTLLDLNNNKPFTRKISNHNVWCPGTPVSLKTLESLGIRLPAFTDTQTADLKKVKALYTGWVEADLTESLKRIEKSGELHVTNVKNNQHHIQILQEVPSPDSPAFNAFTKYMSDVQKQVLKQSYVDFDNNGKHGSAILVSDEETVVRICQDLNEYENVLGSLTEEQKAKVNTLFEAMDATRYDKAPKARRAALYVISSSQETYGAVAMHTDWAKVDASMAVISAAQSLGMVAVGDLNIQTLSDAGIDDAQFNVKDKEAELASLKLELGPDSTQVKVLARNLSLIKAHEKLKGHLAKASGNTLDVICALTVEPSEARECEIQDYLLNPEITEMPKLLCRPTSASRLGLFSTAEESKTIDKPSSPFVHK